MNYNTKLSGERIRLLRIRAGLTQEKTANALNIDQSYHGAYCNRIAENEHRTCQQLAAQETYLEKLKSNDGKNPLSVYQKYYKRYFARVQAGSLKRDKFKQWQYAAVQKRDDCLAGTLTLDELSEWLEGSMPNRSPSKRAPFD